MKMLLKRKKIIQCGEGKSENIDSFFILMCLSLYDYQAKASRYKEGLTYLKKNSTTTNQNRTLHSQKLKSTKA